MEDPAVYTLMLVFAGLALAFFSLIGLIAFCVVAIFLPRGKPQPSLPPSWQPAFQLREEDDAISPA